MPEGANVHALLHVEPRPLLVHTAFPLPLLATLELDAAVYSAELKRHSRTNFLHAHFDILSARNWFSIRAQNRLLCLALITEDIAVAAYKDVITLIMKSKNLTALKFGEWREQILEKLGGKDTKRGLKVIENELWIVACVVCVTGQFLAIDPVGDAEVEVGAFGEVDNVEAVGFLFVLGLHENDEGGVASCGRKAGDFADTVFVCVCMLCTADVCAIGEDGGEDVGFLV